MPSTILVIDCKENFLARVLNTPRILPPFTLSCQKWKAKGESTLVFQAAIKGSVSQTSVTLKCQIYILSRWDRFITIINTNTN